MILLNLLPPERKLELAGRARNRRATAIGSLIIASLVLITIVLFGANLYVGTIVSAQKRRMEQTKTDLARYADLEQLVLSTRDRATALESEEATRLLWSKVADALAAATPEGVQLSQMTVSIARTPHLLFSGQADNKEKVASLRERVEASDRFENVAIRQVGQNQDDSGKLVTTFSLESDLTGVKTAKEPAKPKGVGE